MIIKLDRSQWERIGKYAHWMTDVNMDDISRRRTVKVTMSDGDVITTEINGTKKEIEDYYLKNDFVKEDETTMHRGVKVEFLS
jgi:hypothetical protein